MTRLNRAEGEIHSGWLLGLILVLNGTCFATSLDKFTAGGLEHHFLLDVPVALGESDMKNLPAQIQEMLAPMYILDSSFKSEGRSWGMYVDTKDRRLRKNNMILRVRPGRITIKARGDAPTAVSDVAKCQGKKYEVDTFDRDVYSISSDIKFSSNVFNPTWQTITLQKLSGFIKSTCPSVFHHVKSILEDKLTVIPGVTSQYAFNIRLKDPKKAKLLEYVDFDIWFFPPTNRMVVELSYTGKNQNRTQLLALQKETRAFLQKRGLLHKTQISKTEAYFRAFFTPAWIK